MNYSKVFAFKSVATGLVVAVLSLFAINILNKVNILKLSAFKFIILFIVTELLCIALHKYNKF